MNTHCIQLNSYCATSPGGPIYLGTAGSHGNERLKVVREKGWENLAIQVLFHPCKVAVQLPANGLLDVPWEVTSVPLSAREGRIVFQGFDQDRLVNSSDLHYTVSEHSITVGRDEQPYTPGIVEGVLNQMAADRDAILTSAQQAGQAKEAAIVSAAEAASSAANAQQSAGHAAASASQAEASAMAADETLTQVQASGQKAEQNIKNAATEALDKIAAAAPALPIVSTNAAWQSVTVKPDGTGYGPAALAPISAAIRPTVTGNPTVCANSVAWGLQGLKLYGQSIQDGTPSPENPVPIISSGENGGIDINLSGINKIPYSFIPEYGSKVKCDISLNEDVFSISVRQDGEIYFGGQIAGSSQIGTPWNGDKHLLFPVVPGEKLKIVTSNSYFDANYFCFIDQNMNIVRTLLATDSITVPENAVFATARLGRKQATISDGIQCTTFMVCSEEYIGNFVPYQDVQFFAISTPNGIPGIPVESGGNYTDSNRTHLVCNVKDYGTGKYIQNCAKVVFDGSKDETIRFESTSSADKINFLNVPAKCGSKCICNKLKYSLDDIPNSIYVSLSVKNKLSVVLEKGTIFSDTDARQWVSENNIEVIYQLATPIESDISPEELSVYRSLTTYDGTTMVGTAAPVAGLEVQYVADGTKFLQSVTDRITVLELAQNTIKNTSE